MTVYGLGHLLGRMVTSITDSGSLYDHNNDT